MNQTEKLQAIGHFKEASKWKSLSSLLFDRLRIARAAQKEMGLNFGEALKWADDMYKGSGDAALAKADLKSIVPEKVRRGVSGYWDNLKGTDDMLSPWAAKREKLNLDEELTKRLDQVEDLLTNHPRMGLNHIPGVKNLDEVRLTPRTMDRASPEFGKVDWEETNPRTLVARLLNRPAHSRGTENLRDPFVTNAEQDISDFIKNLGGHRSQWNRTMTTRGLTGAGVGGLGLGLSQLSGE